MGEKKDVEVMVGKQMSQLDDTLKDFVENQKMFFVSTAGVEGRVNVSPKGMDTLRAINPKQLVWLNLTGSGNETAAHVLECNRLTLMFCAFEGNPLIVRMYGKARIIYPHDEEWGNYYSQFPPLPGARQMFFVDIAMVATSCGMGVPCYEFVEERKGLAQWAEKKGAAGLEKYWHDNNQHSIDGKRTKKVG